jgi:hypothetical protein
MVKKKLREAKRRFARRNAVKGGSKLHKTIRMPNKIDCF